MPKGVFPRPSTEERFCSRIDISQGECWLWTGSKSPSGYGWFNEHKRTFRAHKWAYTAFIGEVPDGLVLDHLCRVRHCVNPWHQEPVTLAENCRRGESRLHVRMATEASAAALRARTHCKNGHEFTPANTRPRVVQGRVSRVCRACARAIHKRWKASIK